jgi:Dna[CI] antecedent, DciA
MNEPTSQPERDRSIASRPRYRPRYAQSLSNEMEALLGSETFRRLKRFQKVNDALSECLSDSLIAKLKPVSCKNGQLVIDVNNTILLAELKQHHEPGLLRALARAGTGISRIQWRLAKSTSTRN